MTHTAETKLKISNRVKELFKTNPEKFKRSKKPSVIKNCLFCKKEMWLRPSDKNKFCSAGCRKRAIENGYLKGKCGGYRIGSGRSKSGWYNGIFCNSSYELAWVLFNLENKIPFIRNSDWFEYLNTDGKRSRYYPDYKLLNTDEYVEIKGYKEKEFINKTCNFPKKLIILDKEKMNPILEFVIGKYGKDFISLYEGNPHEKKINSCSVCGKPAKNQYCSRVCAGRGVRLLR
jgi:hypothetical protein